MTTRQPLSKFYAGVALTADLTKSLVFARKPKPRNYTVYIAGDNFVACGSYGQVKPHEAAMSTVSKVSR